MGISINASLWNLILGVMMFSVIFVLCIQFATPVYTAQKQYLAYEVNRDNFRGTDLNSFNGSASLSFNFAQGDSVDKSFSGHSVRITSSTLQSFLGAFSVFHITWSFLIWETIEAMQCLEVKGESNFDGLTVNQILTNTKIYNNSTDTASMTYACDHLTIKFRLSAKDNTTSLKVALQNNLEYHIECFYDLDFSAMGVGIWNILASIFMFQAIQTGNLSADMLLNSLITIPLYVGFGFVL